MKLNTNEQVAVGKIVQNINKKREKEFIEANDPNGIIRQYIEEQKYRADYKRTGKAGWVKVASIPFIVDQFFIKHYGPDYYKEKDFFERFPEWKVIKGDSRKI